MNQDGRAQRRNGGRKFRAPLHCVSILLCAFAPLRLTACTDTGVRPTTVTQVADSADQVLFKMNTNITADGIRRSYVEAETAFVYQSRQTMDLHHVKMRFFDAQGNPKSTLTADRGIYGTYSNKLDARGHVVVTSTDGKKLQTEHLIYDKLANQIKVDTAFVYDSPTEHSTGMGLDTVTEFKNVRVQQPKGFQRGKGMLLPGQ
jgi:LPS export ABC transporter protein LptC